MILKYHRVLKRDWIYFIQRHVFEGREDARKVFTDYFASTNVSVHKRCHRNAVGTFAFFNYGKVHFKVYYHFRTWSHTELIFYRRVLFVSSRRFRRPLFPAGDLPRPPRVLLKELLIQRDEVIQFS